jgi:16S rRNA C967 or C1407 C5-methylase (RsmB/RsmF family)
MLSLPQEFLHKMAGLLGEDYPAFAASLAGTSCQGLRINTLRVSVGDFLSLSPWDLTPIPWCSTGFYYRESDRPGKHIYHFAGMYYIQEPSAMAVAEYVAPQPGEWVLDLAAAPGGKTTHLAALMGGKGLIVANEVHRGRAQVLAQNVERLGIPNVIVTNEQPQRLAQYFPRQFDRVLVDAPCSGEGMFRKKPSRTRGMEPCPCVQLCRTAAAHLGECARPAASGGLVCLFYLYVFAGGERGGCEPLPS